MNLDPGFGWTYNDYRKAMLLFQTANYHISSFQDFLEKPEVKHLILRHDVDFSLEAAHKMARIDHELGITSSFYFRVHASNYNLFSSKGITLVGDFISMGHEVALHLESGVDLLQNREKWETLDGQISAFESLLGIKIAGFSAHEPARLGGLETSDDAKARWNLSYHAYEERFTKEIKYLSDSSGRWREGPMTNFIDQFNCLQVLIHPIWWYEKSPLENY
jgi:hypothetical protein